MSWFPRGEAGLFDFISDSIDSRAFSSKIATALAGDHGEIPDKI
jgi:hypothetical protein